MMFALKKIAPFGRILLILLALLGFYFTIHWFYTNYETTPTYETPPNTELAEVPDRQYVWIRQDTFIHILTKLDQIADSKSFSYETSDSFYIRLTSDTDRNRFERTFNNSAPGISAPLAYETFIDTTNITYVNIKAGTLYSMVQALE